MNIRNDLNNRSPLLISDNKLKYPTDGPNLIFKTNENVDLSCTGEGNLILTDKQYKIQRTSFLTLKCTEDSNFIIAEQNEVDPQHVYLRHFYCTENPDHTLIRSLSTPSLLPCQNRYLATGFPVNKKLFLKVLEICYDTVKYRPILTFSAVSPLQYNKQFKDEDTNILFKANDVFKDMNFAYIGAFQKEQFENVFGKEQRYIRLGKKQHFFIAPN